MTEDDIGSHPQRREPTSCNSHRTAEGYRSRTLGLEARPVTVNDESPDEPPEADLNRDAISHENRQLILLAHPHNAGSRGTVSRRSGNHERWGASMRQGAAAVGRRASGTSVAPPAGRSDNARYLASVVRRGDVRPAVVRRAILCRCHHRPEPPTASMAVHARNSTRIGDTLGSWLLRAWRSSSAS